MRVCRAKSSHFYSSYSVIWVGVLAALLAGCSAREKVTGGEVLASASGLDSVLVLEADFDRVFDAAVEVSRQEGMPAAFKDRRTGVIESQPRIAGSVLEPWRVDNTGFVQGLENTICLHRRTVRFEIQPSGSGENWGEVSNESRRVGDAHLELRAIVTLERASRPGARLSTWSRRAGNRRYTIAQELIFADALEESAGRDVEGASRTSQFWHVVGRDVAYEQRLLARLQDELADRLSDLSSRADQESSEF